MKRIYWIIIIGIVLVAFFVIIKISNGNKPTEVYTEHALVKDIVEIVSATGKIQPEIHLLKRCILRSFAALHRVAIPQSA